MVSTETVLGLKEVLISTSLDMKNHDYFFAISSENLKICSEKYGCKCSHHSSSKKRINQSRIFHKLQLNCLTKSFSLP